MTIEEAKKKALGLIEKSKTVMLATIDENGYPNMRAMFNLEWDGLKTIWFSTNSSAKKIEQIANNPKDGAYFFDEAAFKGLRLMGDIKVRQDQEAREKLWRPGFDTWGPFKLIGGMGKGHPDEQDLNEAAVFAEKLKS